MQADDSQDNPEFDIWKADPMETIYHFQPELVALRRRVASFPEKLQIALGLWCCERLYPPYREWAQLQATQDRLRAVLDRLWRHVDGNEMDRAEIEKGISDCLADDFGDYPDELCWEGIEALGAAWHTLEACRGKSVDHIVMACESCRNRVYQKLSRKYSPDFGGVIRPEDGPVFTRRIYENPEMVREIECQAEAVHLLMEHERMTVSLRERLLGVGIAAGGGA